LIPDGVQYPAYIPHLIAGWQDHDRRLADVEERVNGLEQRIAA
jgi:hypothetical protein